MYNCECLIHPFQNDPGTSQRQRVMDDLLNGAAKIDARSLADLLDFFTQMSAHINFYDTNLSISDWQPFFQKSIPFTLATIIRSQPEELRDKFYFYNKLFGKKPSPQGLQLNASFIYYRFIRKINNWHLSLKDSGLPVANHFQLLIKDELQPYVKRFIELSNAAVKEYGIKKIDFSIIAANHVWNIQPADLSRIDETYQKGTNSKIVRLQNLYDRFTEIAPPFIDALKVLADEAEKNMEASFLPLQEELQKKHPPHLGLLFAFLNIFRQLQDDLNSFTRKHLDFFYKDVLQIKAADATGDKAHVLFEIQKQLEKYLLKKGLLVKDGKDKNKQDILFELDDDIVVNKTVIAEVKTLFLNQQEAFEQTYVEGVYIARDARKADGIEKDFADDQPKNFSSLGAKLSKYTDPETKIIQQNDTARIGFILASAVLYLKEGTRTVTITISCRLIESMCSETGNVQESRNCCDGIDEIGTASGRQNRFLKADELFTEVKNKIGRKYIYLNEQILQEALAKGVDEEFIEKVRDEFLAIESIKEHCYCEEPAYQFETSVFYEDWQAQLSGLTAAQQKIIAEIFQPETVFNVLFSGEKEWINAAETNAHLSNLTGNTFTLTIETVIGPEQPSVVHYDSQALKEDFGVTEPLVKVELNDRLKLKDSIQPLPEEEGGLKGCCEQDDSCCLLRNDQSSPQTISFYHFFRNVEVVKGVTPDETRIDVQVCGLKNFVVQNDESLQDVNGPVYPFGVRPKVESNFFIGIEEVFLKKWADIIINLNWKDLPPIPVTGDFIGKPFQAYYNGYQDLYLEAGIEDKVVEDDKFRVQIAILQDGKWIYRTPLTDCGPLADSGWALFQKEADVNDIGCGENKNFTHQFSLIKDFDFLPAFPLSEEEVAYRGIKRYSVDTRHGFIKITLKCQDFQHDRYPYILARQMTASGKLPAIVNGAVYYGVTVPGPPPVFETLDLPGILNQIIANYELSIDTRSPGFDLIENSKDVINEIINQVRASGNVNASIWDKLFLIDNPSTPFPTNDPPNFPPPPLPFGLDEKDSFYYDRLNRIITWLGELATKIEKLKDKGVVIPNEPWTPIISSMSIDYTASATLEDVELIHLYPFEGTYKAEEVLAQPALLPTFCDEGTLFLGLKNLVPGNNLNLLFQLAEATSDSESEKEQVHWYYLNNNQWKRLRPGFEVIDDATQNLTTSGMVKLALPANMSKDNTAMPKGLHWIKASIPRNSRAVSETVGIHTHAISVNFKNNAENDQSRLGQPLAAESISKLNEADANVKSVLQPYESFGGRVAEMEQQYYVRVSEMLRHKGRAVQKFDYERIVLEAFPQVYKVKCINHSFALNAHKYKNDFPYAPGYVIVAVIPDLYKLKAGNSFAPKVPVSILEKIDSHVRGRISPFVRFRAMNPRYEKVDFCLRVSLLPGKDENFYKEQLKDDIRELLAPWAVGKYDKFSFGQCVYRSDIIRFLEQTDYVDFITDFRMGKEVDTPSDELSKVCPDTPRSILIAGDIEVCINKPGCEEWRMCSDGNENERDCCSTEMIPVANFCRDKNVIR